jgi:hypothetical protein
VTGAKRTLKESRGKVVGVLLRPPGNRRAQTFLEELDQLAKEQEDFAGITLGFYPSRASDKRIEGLRAALRRDIEELGLSLPAGFDATPGQSIFRTLHATVGSPSFLMFDRRGRFAWYRMDPMDLDRALLRRVAQRLLEES